MMCGSKTNKHRFFFIYLFFFSICLCSGSVHREQTGHPAQPLLSVPKERFLSLHPVLTPGPGPNVGLPQPHRPKRPLSICQHTQHLPIWEWQLGMTKAAGAKQTQTGKTLYRWFHSCLFLLFTTLLFAVIGAPGLLSSFTCSFQVIFVPTRGH